MIYYFAKNINMVKYITIPDNIIKEHKTNVVSMVSSNNLLLGFVSSMTGVC